MALGDTIGQSCVVGGARGAITLAYTAGSQLSTATLRFWSSVQTRRRSPRVISSIPLVSVSLASIDPTLSVRACRNVSTPDRFGPPREGPETEAFLRSTYHDNSYILPLLSG
jgi:hypothetical protein